MYILQTVLIVPQNIFKQVCQFLLLGRNVRWPRRIRTLVSHGEYAHDRDRQLDKRTDARPLHYVFTWTQQA